jgi:hypothetical protein
VSESKTKFSAPIQKFAADLKATLIKAEAQIRELRARELSKSISGAELCPLCGAPERDSLCPCVSKLVKSDDIQGGDGTQPMGMAEKKLAKCGPGCSGGKHMDKCDLSEVTAGKDLTKHTMASSSAGALAPKAPVAATPVAHVNQELGGFKSIAGSSPAASGHLMPSPKMNVGTAGRRAGNVQAPVTGMIPNAKAEKNFGSARSPLGTGAPGHASQKNMPSQLKASMAPVAKGEIPAVKGAPEKAAAGTKLPKKGKDVTVAKQGSGGEIKKSASLRKDAAAMAPAPGKAPAGKGVPGKQPVGQGGGDAHKVAGGAPKVAPKPGLDKLKAAGTAEVGRAKGAANVQRLRGDLAAVAAKKAAPPHPITQQGLADVTVAHANHKNAQPSPESVDVDVSDFNQEAAPQTAGQRMAGAPAAGSPQGHADALNGVRDQMNASAKQKGGVGFLRGLFSMFHRGAAAQAADPSLNPAPKWQQQGQTTSARFNGAMPLRRSELSLSEMESDHKEFVKRGLKVN